MLAKGINLFDIPTLLERTPLLGQPKWDGCRLIKLRGHALTRYFNPVPNLALREWAEKWLPDGADGEVILLGQHFTDISSLFRNHRKPIPENFRFIWCDLAVPQMGAAERSRHMLYHSEIHPQVLKSPTVELFNPAAVLEFNEQNLLRGLEGTILRGVNTHYLFKRSTLEEAALLKVKPFSESEAEVIDYSEALENINPPELDNYGLLTRSSSASGLVPKGTLGSLKVRHPQFGEFSIGTGFTLSERDHLWSIRENLRGCIVTFKYQDRPGLLKPAPAVYKDIRRLIP